MAQPLAGIRVLELADGIAGPYAGKLLADYGADVIKLEPPGGDPTRHMGPFPGGNRDPERSALFLHLNTNKRSAVADLSTDQGRRLVLDLAAHSDLVIESSMPGVLDSLGLGFEGLRARRSGLVLLSVTSFGQTGPYAGYKGSEIVHYAVGGPMSASGKPEREPVKMGADLGQYQCGNMGAVAALAAVTMAQRSGEGVHIDLANVESQVASIDRRMTYLLYGAYRDEDVPRFGGYSVSPLPGGVRPSADGYVQVSTLPNWIPRALKVLDDPDLASRYQNPLWVLDPELPELADAALLTWSVSRDKQDAMEEAQAAGWPVTAVNHPVDLLGDPHFADRGFFVTVDHGKAGAVKQPGAPIRMDDGWALRRPAPTLGQHQVEVEREAGATAGLTAGSAAAGAAPAGVSGGAARLPLAGIRVLDMTVVWAGPYATQILGDLGADVIRVDNPWIFPSATRGVLPRPPKEIVANLGGIFGGFPDADPGQRPWNRIALFTAHARGKRSVTLDLRKPLGREMVLRLAERCDVLIENNSVDLLDKLGLSWDELSARNPRLIEVRMPSVGLAGPYRDYLGFGVNFEGLCGLTSLRGYPDLDLTENEAVFHMDAASGASGAFAALAALRRREATGRGELVELSQSENMLNHIGELLIDAAWNGTVHQRLGNRDRVRAPQGVYPCRPSGAADAGATEGAPRAAEATARREADDQWVAISVGDDDEWRALCALSDAGDLAGLTLEERHARHDELDRRIGEWTSGLTADEVFHRCQRAGVTAGPVLHELEALRDPHLRARGMLRPNGSPDLGTHDYPTFAWHWTGPPLAWGPIPLLGGDNEAILRGLLGVSDEEWQALADGGHLSGDYLAPDGSSL
jgi:crotonobetainyl-CoA:carnitine CoA-transferase CaiB-like acyl-CoA transferase